MKIEQELLPPVMPNHIRIKQPTTTKQQGIRFFSETIPVGSLTEDQAEQYADFLRQTFLTHHAELAAKYNKLE